MSRTLSFSHDAAPFSLMQALQAALASYVEPFLVDASPAQIDHGNSLLRLAEPRAVLATRE